jgi:hypothetical protein
MYSWRMGLNLGAEFVSIIIVAVDVHDNLILQNKNNQRIEYSSKG